MRLLFVGDIIGRAGRTALTNLLPDLRRRWALDCVVVNGENAAGGFGITEAICQEFLDAGADCVTLGNHSFDQREALVFIARQPRLIRPLNYPKGTPGSGAALIEVTDGRQVLVINAMGRIFMDAMDDPFAAVDAELDACPLGRVCDAAIIDFHAEATSEKMAFGHFVDGRASLVVGTHTHVPTADHQILPGGTAYMSDAGMTGDYDSVIGMDKDEPVRRMVRKTPGARFEPALGAATLCGVAVETDALGHATMVAPVRLGGRLSEARPQAWEG
jgi:metallophosphoesterase (TIGR00282 family)